MRKYEKKLKSFFIMLLIIAIALQQFSLSTGASEVNQLNRIKLMLSTANKNLGN